MSTTFFAAGKAIPQGSGRAIKNAKTGEAVFIQSNRSALNGWREIVGNAARMAGIHYQESGPVWLRLEFRLARPKSIPKDRCGLPTTTPDIDKVQRACLDALTAVAYRDDSQVVGVDASKRYCAPGEPAGVWVEILDRPAVTCQGPLL